VAVIRSGEIVTLEAVEALREKSGQQVTVEFGDVAAVSEQELERIPGVSALRKTNGIYHFNISGSMDRLIKELSQYEVIRMTSQEAPLEEVFLKFYQEPAQAAPVA
jgi:ABC-2 type transport system ATP-binding protein